MLFYLKFDWFLFAKGDSKNHFFGISVSVKMTPYLQVWLHLYLALKIKYLYTDVCIDLNYYLLHYYIKYDQVCELL